MVTLGIAKPILRKKGELSVEVVKVLTEVAAWCSRRPLHISELRSTELDPSSTVAIPTWSDAKEIHQWVETKYERYHRAVTEITEKRSVLLREANMATQEWSTAQSQGRVLAYEPLENVEDGAAEASSRGFFDGQDAPPWDTWILYANHTIYSWVPETFYSVAQAGIDANPVDCIHWADWRDLPTHLQ